MPYKRGDGNLYITFNEMGHGEFVLIALPNGKLMVIDCGSNRFDGNYYQVKPDPRVLLRLALESAFNDERFLANNKIIDLLILTHPDKDHCCYLPHLFVSSYEGHVPATKALQGLYSATLNEYEKHAVPVNILKKVDELYSITINQTNRQYGKVDESKYPKSDYVIPKDFETSAANTAELFKKSDVAATRGAVKVLNGGVDGGIACDVYILASNVAAYDNVNDGSLTPDNRKSIVTMIIYGDKRLLFMGDSTFHTEKFLSDTYGNLVKDVDVFHVPHHASITTSSSSAGRPPGTPIDFVNRVNPFYAVICAAWDVGQQLALPRYEIIDLYHNGSRLKTKPAEMDDKFKYIACYKEVETTVTADRGSEGKAVKKRTQISKANASYHAFKHIWCTGSHGAIDFAYGPKAGVVEFLPPQPDKDDE